MGWHKTMLNKTGLQNPISSLVNDKNYSFFFLVPCTFNLRPIPLLIISKFVAISYTLHDHVMIYCMLYFDVHKCECVSYKCYKEALHTHLPMSLYVVHINIRNKKYFLIF